MNFKWTRFFRSVVCQFFQRGDTYCSVSQTVLCFACFHCFRYSVRDHQHRSEAIIIYAHTIFFYIFINHRNNTNIHRIFSIRGTFLHLFFCGIFSIFYAAFLFDVENFTFSWSQFNDWLNFTHSKSMQSDEISLAFVYFAVWWRNKKSKIINQMIRTIELLWLHLIFAITFMISDIFSFR